MGRQVFVSFFSPLIICRSLKGKTPRLSGHVAYCRAIECSRYQCLCVKGYRPSIPFGRGFAEKPSWNPYRYSEQLLHSPSCFARYENMCYRSPACSRCLPRAERETSNRVQCGNKFTGSRVTEYTGARKCYWGP